MSNRKILEYMQQDVNYLKWTFDMLAMMIMFIMIAFSRDYWYPWLTIGLCTVFIANVFQVVYFFVKGQLRKRRRKRRARENIEMQSLRDLKKEALGIDDQKDQWSQSDKEFRSSVASNINSIIKILEERVTLLVPLESVREDIKDEFELHREFIAKKYNCEDYNE
ncbi:MAG: hypothetical protein OXC92_11015 [Flavobacteriaceae bacterium]|nr:hypothetical protein [Flavobacteriaceae bacterium]